MTVTATYYLELNGVPLDTHAWRCLSYDDLLNGPAVRGSDRVLPRATGVRPLPRKVDATVVSLSMLVVGAMSENGTANTIPFEGMMAHRDYLRANLGLGSEDGDGTVPAIFHRGTLDPLSGFVTVLAMADWEVIGEDGEATFRLDISIPAGELAGAAS